MKQFFLLLIFFCTLACTHSQQTANPIAADSVTKKSQLPHYSQILARIIPDSVSPAFQSLYLSLKDSMRIRRNAFSLAYANARSTTEKNSVLDSAAAYLQRTVVNDVFPFWYGTTWDFNGITETPRSGFIACGYFVSTTLKHAGFNLNRYKLAQQYSHSIVNTLSADVKTFTNLPAMIAYLQTQPDNLYTIGLDNHVGFINKKGSDITFIHSSYVSPGYVTSEQAAQSLVLTYSNLYVLGNVTANRTLLLRWLQGEAIVILP